MQKGTFLTSPRGSSRNSVDVHSPLEHNDIEVQIILKGDVDVGKKTLMRSFMISAEASFIHSTWSSKRCTIDGLTYRVRVGIEHIGVTEPLPPIDPNYCGHMLCYDVTNQRSFDSAMHLAGFHVQTLSGDNKVRRSSLGNTSSKSPTPLVSPLPALASLPPVAIRPLSEPSMVVVGTKADLVKQRAISYEGAKKDALSVGLDYVETSARETFGVDVAFILLLCNIHERLKRFVSSQHEALTHHKSESGTGTISKLKASLSMYSKKPKETLIAPAPVLTAGLGSRLVSDAIREELAFQAYQSWLTDGTMRRYIAHSGEVFFYTPSLRLGAMAPGPLETLLKSKFAALDSESPPALAIQAVMNAGYLLGHNTGLRTLVLETAHGKGSARAVWNIDCAQAIAHATHLTDLTIRGYDLNVNAFWLPSHLPSHLVSLTLSACNLQPEALLRIAPTLRHCAVLEKLNLSRNPLHSTAAVARVVVLLRGVLRTLDVSECEIETEEQVRPLMQALCHSMLRSVSLLKNQLNLDAVIYVFSCAPAFAALSTLLVDHPQESLSLQSAHELWLSLQANSTLTDIGPFLRDIDSHRLSEAMAYLDRNKTLLAKAKRTLPLLSDLASWELRKSALLFRPLSSLSAFVNRKLPMHLCPPLRRLIQCALPSTEEVNSWCADSRSPALFPTGVARSFAALPRLQLKHNNSRLKRNHAYRTFHETCSHLPIGALLVLIDMSGRDLDSAQRQLRRLYPALHSSASSPLLTPHSTSSSSPSDRGSVSPIRSPRRALTYFNSPSPSAAAATKHISEAATVKKAPPLVYFVPIAQRTEGANTREEKDKHQMKPAEATEAAAKEKRGVVYYGSAKEEGVARPTSPVPAPRGLAYFPAKIAAAEENKEHIEKKSEPHARLAYLAGAKSEEAPKAKEEDTAVKTEEEKAEPAKPTARGLSYFPAVASEDKRVEETKKDEAKPTRSLAYFPPKAAVVVETDHKRVEDSAAAKDVEVAPASAAPRIAYFVAKAAVVEEKKTEETKVVADNKDKKESGVPSLLPVPASSSSSPSPPSPSRPHLTYYAPQDPVQREKSPRRLSYFPAQPLASPAPKTGSPPPSAGPSPLIAASPVAAPAHQWSPEAGRVSPQRVSPQRSSGPGAQNFPRNEPEKREERRAMHSRSLSGQYRRDAIERNRADSTDDARKEQKVEDKIVIDDKKEDKVPRKSLGLVYYAGDTEKEKEEKRLSAERASAERQAAALNAEKERAKEKLQLQLRLDQDLAHHLRDSPLSLAPILLSHASITPPASPKSPLPRHRSLAYFPANPPSPKVSQVLTSASTLAVADGLHSTPHPSPSLHASAIAPSAGSPSQARTHLTYYASQDPVHREKSPRRSLSYYPSQAPKST